MSSTQSTTITECRCCQSPQLDLILDLGSQPPANSLRAELAQKLATFPLVICRCAACATVQLTETVNPELLFQSYVWVTGTSRVAQDYSQKFCQQLRELAGPKRKLFAVEIASNDGTFLRRFLEAGDRVLGVDPARNIAQRANADGIFTWPEFFSRQIAQRICAEQGEADIIFARNVLPHVPDPSAILQGMADCLHADGIAAIEFHHAQVIFEELHYDSIYHEHYSYFSLKTLGALLNRAGLHIFDVMPSPISGGSLVVYCSKSPRPASSRLQEYQTREDASGTNSLERWQEFARRSREHRDRLRSMVDVWVAEGRRAIGYGASARGSTLLNFTGITHRQLIAMADRNPLKHHLLTPGTDIRILPPAEALALQPDSVLLLAWNFRDEIVGELREAGFRGQVLLPLPGAPHVVEVSP